MRLLSPNSLKATDRDPLVRTWQTMLPGYSAIHLLSAGGAEPRAFHIGVVQGIGEEHDAPGVAAVPEPVGVAQLVDRFLDRAFRPQPTL